MATGRLFMARPARTKGGISDRLAVRASKKLRSDEALVISLGATILRKHMDDVPLWRGDHVPVKQLVEDFARYLYLPRIKDSTVLLNAISDGVNLLTWEQDSFAFADRFDDTAGRYKRLRCGTMVSLIDGHAPSLVVKPDVAARQKESERVSQSTGVAPNQTPTDTSGEQPALPAAAQGSVGTPGLTRPTRYHGSAVLDATRVGRDASKIAEEVIAHLSGLVSVDVTVTLEIEANIPDGVPDNVVRTIIENGRTLKFSSGGFEKD
jgi:hypothetical protein